MVEQEIGGILRILEQLPTELDVPVDEKMVANWQARLASGQPVLAENEFPVGEASRYLSEIIRRESGCLPDKREVKQLILRYLADETADAQWQKYALPAKRGEAWTHLACQTALGRLADNVRRFVTWQDWQQPICPVCGTAPSFASLEGTEGQRKLICGSCFTRWRYKRIGCAFCSEEEPARLKVLTLEEFPGWSAAVCLTCQSYIKTADLRQMASAPRWQQAVLDTLAIDYAVSRWVKASAALH